MVDQKQQRPRLHVAMFPYLAFGHISPFVQLTNNLSRHGVKVSFISAPSNVDRIKSSLRNPHLVHFYTFTLPAVDGLPTDLQSTAQMTPKMAELLKKALDATQPQITALLASSHPDIVLFDFGQQWLPTLAASLGIKTLFFSVFSAISTAYITVPSRLPEQTARLPTFEELMGPPPGFPKGTAARLSAHEARDVCYVFKSFEGCPSVFERVLHCLRSADGILMKTCNEMEAGYIDYARRQLCKPVLLCGPIPPDAPVGELDRGWGDWLDRFPEGSVVFCSFGSETFLGDAQIGELLLGLEATGAPFIVVLNFRVGEAAYVVAHLPEGFLGRVEGRGRVHSGWVQQVHILAHRSVGCYACHAGFSSVMEAMMNGCQLALVPQKGDQFLNAKLVAGDLKAGVEVRRDEQTGEFRREDVQEAVERAMGLGKWKGDPASEEIRENNRRWGEFLRDKDAHERNAMDLVGAMEEMVYGAVSPENGAI